MSCAGSCMYLRDINGLCFTCRFDHCTFTYRLTMFASTDHKKAFSYFMPCLHETTIDILYIEPHRYFIPKEISSRLDVNKIAIIL